SFCLSAGIKTLRRGISKCPKNTGRSTMPKRTSSFRDDLLADLADPREAASYLNAAMEDSEEMFLVALRDVAEAKQMAKVAEGAGVARESVYRMLTAKGNPTYTSLLGILHAVGLKMAITVEAVTSAPIQPVG